MQKYLVLAAALALLGACDSTDPRVPTSVEVQVDALNLLVGETTGVQAAVADQRGRAYDVPPEGFEILWTSSDESVATVADGEILGIASGVATIRAQAGTLPPADIEVQVHGSLEITGTFDLPIIAEDDPDGREVHAEIGFSYDGHRSGSFGVDETFVFEDLTGADSYAFTFFNSDFGDQDFVALQWRADGTIDYTEFYVDGGVTETGDFTVYLGFLVLGFDPNTDTADVEYVLEVHPGSMTVASATEGQLAGSFTFTMEVDLAASVLAVAADGESRASSRLRRHLRQ